METDSECDNSSAAVATPLFQTQPPEQVMGRRDGPSGSQKATTGDRNAGGKVSASSNATSSGDRHTVGAGRRPAKSSSHSTTQNGKQTDPLFYLLIYYHLILT